MNFYLYHSPIGVIDVDTHDSEINPNNFRDSLNIRNVTSYVGKKQVLSNLKGNLIVSYNLGGTKQKVIGSYEDKAGQTILYFLWDKDLNHRILRYYPNKISSAFPRGQIEQIIAYDFGWKENTKITNIDLVDGKLLYWTDPKPRKINIEKANLNGKLKTWKVIFPENYTDALFAPNLSVAVQNRETGSGGLTDTSFEFLANTPRATVLSDFTDYLNSKFGTTFPNNNISATLCDDCSIEVEEIKEGDWNLTITGTAPFLVISDNWYGNTPLLASNGLSERTFDRIKYPPVYQPLNEHKQDLVKNFNYIKGKVFQFRTQFHYDDNESSKLSPISQISINNTTNSTDEPLYNYIQVNLNNDIFTNSILTLIDRVSILFREGNDGEWQKIDDFDVCQLYYYESSTKKLIYNFYNNTSSSGISDVLSNAQYDKVAIEAQASAVIENRILDGNITDDYDVERCVDVDVEITIEDAVQEEFVTLYGYIKIHSYRMNDSSYRSAAPPDNFPFYSFPYIEPQSGKLRGVISHDTSNPNNFPTFGGLMYGYGDGWDFGMTANINETWGQAIPEGGFPVYSAGTEFMTISRQVQVGGLGVTDGGALDVSSASKIAQIGAYLQNVNNQCYSIFTLQVPKCKHVIRLASHLCSFDDKLNLGDCYNLTNNSYQKTSTYVNGHFDSSNVWQGGKKEIVVDASAMTGDNFIGTFVVQDLCPSFDELMGTPTSSGDSILEENSTYYYAWKNIVGYLYDDNGAVNPNDAGYDGIPVTGAYVRGTVFDNRFPSNRFYDERLDAFTDHNGFFFFTAMRHDNDADDSALYISAFQVAPLVNPPFVTGEYGHGNLLLPNYPFYTTFGEIPANYANIDVFPNTGNCTTIHSFSQNKYAGYLSNLITKTLSPTLYGWDVPSTFPTVVLELDSSGTTNIVISTDVANLRTTHAVSVSGNASVEGASIIATGGAVAKSIVGGNYQLYVWGNMYYSSRYDTTNGGLFSDSALDPFVVFTQNNDRVFDIIFQKGSLSLGTPVPTSYSHTVTFPAANITTDDFTVSTIAGLVEKALKRGGNYSAGIRYYDSANRSSDVLIDPSMNFYIPFITEDLNKYLPNYGVTTYRTGVPSVEFTLNHTPPSWANTFQILISENLNQLNFLQFKVNEVKYVVQSASDGVPEITTNELNSSVTQLKISLENINIYYRKNNDSNVGWNYTKGDKIRLITNGEGTYYQGLYEFEVVSYEAPNWYLIKYNGTDVKIGSLIEIFSQKINSSEQLFYEMGECFPISAHATPITLSGGDTYWRKRTIPVINDYFNIYNNYPATIESNTISDFYPSKASDIGRIGINDPNYKRTYKISSIRLSNNYIVGSQINGLSENENVDDIDLGIIYGGIRHFVELGENILSVNENRVVALYKGNVLAKTGETGLLAITNEFIGDRRPLLGDFGSQNPESIKRNDNEVYGFDAYRGIVWKYDNNGFNLISSNGMKTYFEGISNLGVWESPSVYDTRYDEYILSIYPNIVGEVVLGGGNVLTGTTLQFADAAIYDNLAVGDMVIVSYKKLGVSKQTNGIVTSKGVTIVATVDDIGSAADPSSTIFIKFKDKARMTTIAYSPINKGWTSKYSFTPEYYGSFKKDIVSFVNGELWVHDVNPLRNTFYGTAYKSFITFVANGLSTKGIGNIVKIFKAITLVGKQLSGGNNWSAPTISNGTQLSRLLVSKFVKREENWHSEFMRDINSTGGILNGNTLRSEELTIKLENNATEEVVLEQVNILANDSKRN